MAKEIICAFGTDIDSVAGWIGSYGGGDSPSDIQRGVFASEVGNIRFSTAFGRGLDYYTGFVFELHDPAATPNGPLVAGGRYDELLTRLGAKAPIPAVGFAVWIERVAQSGAKS